MQAWIVCLDRWELEVLQQKHDRAVAERDELHSQFSRSVLDLQEKSSLKYAVLDRKISALRKELDVRDAQLHSLVTQEGDGPGGKRTLRQTYVMDSVRDVVEEQAAHIRGLERSLLIMRQRRQWGDDDDGEEDDGAGVEHPGASPDRDDAVPEVRGARKMLQPRESRSSTASEATSRSEGSSSISGSSYSNTDSDDPVTPASKKS